MEEKIPLYQSVKQHIRIFLDINDGKSEMEHFDYQRNDGYKTSIDAGFEDLDLQKDSAKIMLYMQNNIITFNNGKKYQITKREFQPCLPVMLILHVEEIKKSIDNLLRYFGDEENSRTFREFLL